MVDREERVEMSMAQFDDTLRQWKKKGAERTFGFVFTGSLPLVFLGGFASPDVSGEWMIVACATYYCAIAFWAVVTL